MARRRGEYRSTIWALHKEWVAAAAAAAAAEAESAAAGGGSA